MSSLIPSDFQSIEDALTGGAEQMNTHNQNVYRALEDDMQHPHCFSRLRNLLRLKNPGGSHLIGLGHSLRKIMKMTSPRYQLIQRCRNKRITWIHWHQPQYHSLFESFPLILRSRRTGSPQKKAPTMRMRSTRSRTRIQRPYHHERALNEVLPNNIKPNNKSPRINAFLPN